MIPPGQTAAIVTMTANSLQAGISEKLGHLCSSLSVVVTGVIMSLVFDWALTIVVGLGLVLVVFVYTFATGAVSTKMADIQNVDIQSASVATDALTSMKMLAACGAESKMVDRYSEVVDKTRRIGAQMACLLGVQHGLSENTRLTTVSPVVRTAHLCLLGLNGLLTVTPCSLFYHQHVGPTP